MSALHYFYSILKKLFILFHFLSSFILVMAIFLNDIFLHLKQLHSHINAIEIDVLETEPRASNFKEKNNIGENALIIRLKIWVT